MNLKLVSVIAVLFLGILWLSIRAGRPDEAALAVTQHAPEAGNDRESGELPESAAHVGKSPERAPAVLSPSGPPTVADEADDPVQCILFGRITQAGGAPLDKPSDGFVRFTDQGGESSHARPDERGAYSISGLAPGEWWLSASARGYLPEMRRIELDLSQPTRRLDFALERQPTLKVKVTSPEGDPIFQALREAEPPIHALEFLAVATRSRPDKWFFEVRGSLNNPFGIGHYWQSGFASERLPDEYIGNLRLDEGPPAWVSLVMFHHVLSSQYVEAGATEVAFVLDPELLREALATARVRLLDAETDEPLQGVRVEFTGGSTVMYRGQVSGEDGWFMAEDQTPGKHELIVHLEGYEMYRAEVLLEAGGVTDLGTIALRKAVMIRGRVTDAMGAPLVAKVRYQRLDRAPTSRWGIFSTEVMSDALGKFEIPHLGRGEFLVSVGGRDEARRSPGVPVDTRGGAVDGVQLVAGEAAALVLVPPTQWRGTHFTLDDEEGRRAYSSRFYSAMPRRLELAPGTYSIEFTDAEGERFGEHTVVLGVEPVVLEL